MNRKNKLNYTNYFLRFFSVLSAVAILIKIETGLSSQKLSASQSNKTEIQLVVSEKQKFYFLLHQSNFVFKQIPNSNFLNSEFINLYKYSLISYDNYVHYQLKTYKDSFSSTQQIISILQKKSISHLSSDDNPHLIG
jgi:hypothetical protein